MPLFFMRHNKNRISKVKHESVVKDEKSVEIVLSSSVSQV